jgi:adenylylsulfate kinase-like enzyme
VPENPELIIDTDKETLNESVSKILNYLEENILIS